MKLLCATVTLFFPTLIASQEIEGGLRGAVVEPNEHDRNLPSVGGSSYVKTLGFSYASSTSEFCFDAYTGCLEGGISLEGATSSFSDAVGNAFAIATSEQSLWLDATCLAYKEAQSRACAFTKVDGYLKVNTTNSNGYKDISLILQLKTATLTVALATSAAVAETYAEVNAQSFTSVTAFCSAVKNKSILCGGDAATELKSIAVARSGAFGAASSLAKSGSVTDSSLQVSGRGTGVDYINGVIMAYATSWAFSNAGAIVNSMADAYVGAASNSFAFLCVKEHERVCADESNHGKGICTIDAPAACDLAAASGIAYGDALAEKCATAYANAIASTQINAGISANLACKSVPVLTWSCADAYSEIVCPK